MKPTALFERGLETLAWLEAYADGPPKDCPTTIQDQFRTLGNVVKLASDYVKTDEAKQFLGFCLTDLEKALRAYESGDEGTGSKHLDSARRWFEDAQRDAKSKPTFLVGPNGEARKV